MMRKLILLLPMFYLVQELTAQKKVRIEEIRCLSSVGPLMNYWRSEDVRKGITKQLVQSLSQKWKLQLSDTTVLPVVIMSNSRNANTFKPAFQDADTNHIHLYLDFFELDPNAYFSYAKPDPKDSGIQKRSTSIFLLKAWLLNYKKDVLYSDALTISVVPSKTNAIGNSYANFIRYNKLVTTASGFTEVLRKGVSILLDSSNMLYLIEISAPPAFVGDNYIITKVVRSGGGIPVVAKKGVASYSYQHKQEIIRFGELLYEELKIRGKNQVNYPEEINTAIRRANNTTNSGFIFLRQDTRDVARDKNYFIKLVAQINPDFILAGADLPFSNLLEGKIHCLFLDKDTLARFSVRRNVGDETGKKIYPNMVTNGTDSSFFLLRDMTPQPEWPVMYDYYISGTIGHQNFTISFSGLDSRIKEISLNNKLVCIAEGRFNLEKFAMIDASVPPELLNQLFMIAFCRFFE